VSGPITLVTTGAALGSLGSGAVGSATFSVAATAGAVGDEVLLAVTCVESGREWSSELPLVLGQAGWTALPVDPAGDALPGASLDLRDGRWRKVGDLLEIELTGAGPIDLATAQFELWMSSPGAVWSFHAVTVLAGTPQFFGVQFGAFTPLPTPGLVAVDADTLRITLDTAAMGLADPELQLAVGTGFCGASSFYCDNWPDGWGDPYVGPIDPATWFRLAW
jgi:hypothetical protein